MLFRSEGLASAILSAATLLEMQAVLIDGQWQFAHQDGRPYPARNGAGA